MVLYRESASPATSRRNGLSWAAVTRPDVTGLDNVQRFIDFALHLHACVGVIINNASVMPPSKLEALKVDEWNQMIDVNVRSVLHRIAAALPVMQRQGTGQVINLASIGAYTVSATAAG